MIFRIHNFIRHIQAETINGIGKLICIKFLVQFIVFQPLIHVRPAAAEIFCRQYPLDHSAVLYHIRQISHVLQIALRKRNCLINGLLHGIIRFFPVIADNLRIAEKAQKNLHQNQWNREIQHHSLTHR